MTQDKRQSRAFHRTIGGTKVLAALGLIVGLTAFSRAQDQQPKMNEPGNFDSPQRQQSTPARRGGTAGTARVQAHSPRDDKGQWSPTDFAKANPKLPTLVIAGDSTASTGDPNHRGWGAPLFD